jgi:hypothetical protein
LPTFAKDELFAYLCVHGAFHGWSRVKWLADLAALIAQESPAEVERLYRRSQELGAGPCSGHALLLCQDLFYSTVPEALGRELSRDRRIAMLKNVALSILLSGAERDVYEGRPTWRLLCAQALIGRSWGHLGELVRSYWYHFGDREQFPLPRQLSFLYHFLRLPLAGWRMAGRKSGRVGAQPRGVKSLLDQPQG